MLIEMYEDEYYPYYGVYSPDRALLPDRTFDVPEDVVKRWEQVEQEWTYVQQEKKHYYWKKMLP